MKEAPADRRVVTMNGEDIVLDSEEMKFTDTSLDSFMQRAYGWLDYFGRRVADAQAIYKMRKKDWEAEQNEKFALYKDTHQGSDKWCDAKSKSDPDVLVLHEAMIKAEHNWQLLKEHRLAWDEAADLAKNRGHNMRKEMDKLNMTIYQEERSLRRDADDYLKEMTDVQEAPA